MNGSANFVATYAVAPTYIELYEDGVAPDTIPDMREAFANSIKKQGGLSNDGEIVILYLWAGQSDLVTDLDYAVWGDKVEAVDKTGISIDGPDADLVASTYLLDTAISTQDVVGTGGQPTRVWHDLSAHGRDRGGRRRSVVTVSRGMMRPRRICTTRGQNTIPPPTLAQQCCS